MPTWGWIVIAIAAVVVLAAIAWSAYSSKRRKGLQDRFGSEYDHTVADAPSRREAESELAEREKRREELEIRPLEPQARDRYASEWHNTQAKFVDDPQAAVGDADRLIQQVMRERGYPVEDFDQRADDLSVDYPEVVENYRNARDLARQGETEDLRRAMRQQRMLFEQLVGAVDEPAEAAVGRR